MQRFTERRGQYLGKIHLPYDAADAPRRGRPVTTISENIRCVQASIDEDRWLTSSVTT